MGNVFGVIVAVFVVITIASSVYKGVSRRKEAEKKQQMLAERQRKTSETPVKTTTMAEAKKKSVHGHPVADRMVKIESAFTENGMGGDITEGCEEHYNERSILLDEDKVNVSSKMDRKELAKIIVLGEVLGQPKAKTLRYRSK